MHQYKALNFCSTSWRSQIIISLSVRFHFIDIRINELLANLILVLPSIARSTIRVSGESTIFVIGDVRYSLLVSNTYGCCSSVYLSACSWWAEPRRILRFKTLLSQSHKPLWRTTDIFLFPKLSRSRLFFYSFSFQTKSRRVESNR